jgi:hypothetical protein
MIAATFLDATAASAAVELLGRPPGAMVVVAPAAVAESDDGPISRAATIVAVSLEGDEEVVRRVRDTLRTAGGRVVADTEAETQEAT